MAHKKNFYTRLSKEFKMCFCCHKNDLALLPEVAKFQRIMKGTYIKFRCSLYEKKLLKNRAKRAGISLSEYCRRTAFDQNVIERLTRDQIAHYSMLVQYKNHFSRISNMFKNRNPRLAEEVAQLAEQIRTHLYHFKK